MFRRRIERTTRHIAIIGGVAVALGFLAVSMWNTTSSEHLVAAAAAGETESAPSPVLAIDAIIDPITPDVVPLDSASPAADVAATDIASAAVVDAPPTDATAEPQVEEPPDTGSCGGDLPPCWVRERESGGDYRAVNRRGCGGRGCFGAWQFDPRTWNNFMGFADPRDAPPSVQDAKAREVWNNGRGCSQWSGPNWSACRR